MAKAEIRKKSRWILRAMEWDDTRARYPNLWHEGMPRNVLALDKAADRLRLGDLIASYYPTSTKYPHRSNRYLGISRVVGLRQTDQGQAWIDLETAHRFEPPLGHPSAPPRVFMCCDPGWPEPHVDLFKELFDTAVAQGWSPRPDEVVESGAEAEPAPETVAAPKPSEPQPVKPEPVRIYRPSANERLFAGADYCGDMRDPRESTWLGVLALDGEKLHVISLNPTGRSGLQSMLRDPQRELMHAEAIGLGFPFGLPEAFAENLLGGPFPEEGWWALAKRLERVSWPDYLMALQDFREAKGELLRLADEKAQAVSPLHRVEPDMGSRCYHGIRMIAEDRSRFAIRPFESAKGKLLFEVYPDAAVRRWNVPEGLAGGELRRAIVSTLEQLERWPVTLDPSFLPACVKSRDALDAVIAARCAAVAVLTSEADKTPAELAPEHADRVRREGWIYGLQENG